MDLILVMQLFLCFINPLQTAYNYFAVQHTLALQLAAPLSSNQLAFKFYKEKEAALFLVLSFSTTSYSFYYYPRSAQFCISKANGGTALLNIEYGLWQNIVASANSIQLNSVSIALNTPSCPHSLLSSSFSAILLEIKIDSSLVNTLSLSSLRQFPMESCLSSTGSTCTDCVSGFKLSSNSCVMLPYGCTNGDSSGCTQCREGFTHLSNKCKNAQTSLVSKNSYLINPIIPVVITNQYWAFQIYLMILPSHTNNISTSYTLLTLTAALISIQVELEYSYQRNLGTNALHIYLKRSLKPDGNKLEIPIGEWLFLNLYSTSSDHELEVRAYGTSKIEGVTTSGIASLALGLKSADFIIYMKELLIWNQNIAANSLINSHTCVLTHTNSFLPYARFNLDFDVDSTTSLLIDTMGSITSIALSLPGGASPASLIQTYQPISQFTNQCFQSSSSNLPTCSICTPSCAVCSDLYTCTSCANGILLNGICFTHSINTLSGRALTTNFSLDLSDFTHINTHVNIELIESSSLSKVFFQNAYLKYPDNSELSITNTSMFQAPRYQAIGVSQFQAQLFLKYVINSKNFVTKMADLLISQQPFSPAELLVTSIQSTQSQQNVCKCTVFGTCNLVTGKCNCDMGYSGYLCNYETTTLQNYKKQVTEMVNSLILSNLTFIQILQEFKEISTEPSAITKATALQIIDFIQSKLTPYALISELQLTISILSNLSIKVNYELDLKIEIALAIRKLINSIELNFINNHVQFEISSPHITLKLQAIDPSLPHLIKPSSSSSSELELHDKLLNVSAPTILATVYCEQHLYEGVAPSYSLQASSSLTVNIYQNKVLQDLNNLNDPIILRFAINPDFPVLQNQVSTRPVGCYYYDPQLTQVQQRGCELASVNSTFIICHCYHLTDFMTFLKTGETVITTSNYDVLLSISRLTASNLKNNLGVYIAAGYWGLYLILLTIVASIDRAKMKRKFFKSLFLVVREVQAPQVDQHGKFFYNLNTESSTKVSPQKTKKITPLRDSNGSSSQLRSMFKVSSVHNQDDQAQQSIILEDYSESFHSQKKLPRFHPVTSIGVNTDPQLAPNDFKKLESYSLSMLIRIRINSILGSEYYKKSCFCAFQKLARSELEANNQIYNLFAKTSPLNKRALRLSLFFMAILLQVTMVAFFYNLSPTSSDLPLFWDGIVQNFWISLYSVLFALLPLLLVGLLFSVPKKWMARIKAAKKITEVEEIYKDLKCKIKCRVLAGLILFVLLSCFLLLFIIAFCHVASPQAASEWIISSLIAFAIDQLVFELIPAIAIACFGIAKGFCRGCSGLLSVMIAIEIYRIYKNLVLG